MEKKRALVVGGSNGIGLSLVMSLIKEYNYREVYILDRSKPEFDHERITYIPFNLLNDDFSILETIDNIDTLIITAGFGRIAAFRDLTEIEIINNIKVNTMAIIRIIKRYYSYILNKDNFYCAIMGSIAGFVSSPLFSVYGASKAAVCKFIESVNIELEKSDSNNKILNVSPGSIKGTKFNNGINDISLTLDLAHEILEKMFCKEELLIPDYDKTYRAVLQKYYNNAHEFGLESYEYKMKSNRIVKNPQVKVGYLSGTFDLFHIGHLNLLRRAKEYCDYLVVGVHIDATHKNKEVFIPFNERIEIVKNIKYVDKVIQSYPEDITAYQDIKYDFLFVGSDYKGSDRFLRYEKYFMDKNVKIKYFPYTLGTSSTKLRSAIDNQNSFETITHSSIDK